MKKRGVKTLAFLGLADAYGEAYLKAFQAKSEAYGIKVVAAERFQRADQTVGGQVLGVLASKADAVIVVAIGGGAALPQKTLAARGYKGLIYHSPSSVSPDFLRLSGAAAKGALVISGPEQVPEQLPDSHPGKKLGLDFVQKYEAKFGPGSRTQFAAHIYDFSLVMQAIVPVALKTAQPGTPEFRKALRDALESYGPINTSKGPLHYTPTDHWGYGPSARVMLTPNDALNDWKLVQ
jgi:branched-chain amino acid transport system substrate-binding protein